MVRAALPKDQEDHLPKAPAASNFDGRNNPHDASQRDSGEIHREVRRRNTRHKSSGDPTISAVCITDKAIEVFRGKIDDPLSRILFNAAIAWCKSKRGKIEIRQV